MENNRTNSIMKFWTFLSFILIPMFLFMIFNTSDRLKTANKVNEDLTKKMSTTNWALNKETHLADSMSKILTPIAKYIPMASALQYRDSVCSKLPFGTGDNVMLKPGTSKWVIKAVLITGGQWQHTVTYLLRDSTGNRIIEVEPESVY